jgi:hypothetical protein
MAVEFSPAPYRGRISPISWPAIFASLAVGISVMLLLTLAGVAVGIAVVDPGADSPIAITIGAAAWQTASMLIAAIVGGYVAARLSGLRRTGDGVLHGAVSWGATTLLYAVLATTALGSLTAGMFGLLAPGSTERAASAPGLNPDRDQTQRALEGLGLTADQVRTLTERLTGSGNAGSANAASEVPSAGAKPQLEAATGSVGTATGWLSATVLLTLVLSIVGGAFGTRGSRRVHHRRDQRETARPAVNETPPQVLGRQT